LESYLGPSNKAVKHRLIGPLSFAAHKSRGGRYFFHVPQKDRLPPKPLPRAVSLAPTRQLSPPQTPPRRPWMPCWPPSSSAEASPPSRTPSPEPFQPITVRGPPSAQPLSTAAGAVSRSSPLLPSHLPRHYPLLRMREIRVAPGGW
jgi:hypothetical protein